ncbi:hypothetical protein N431DRAFT_556282, partial [Stipitochalara longipes BDJ]
MSSPSLWAQAAASLGPDDQLPFNLNDPTVKTSIDDALKPAKLMQEHCKKKLWKYENKRGEVVILRDVFAKVVNAIDKFNEIGDIIVQYDPVHAALSWAATFGAMVEGLELVSDLIPRCSLWEQLYLTKRSTMTAQLSKGILKLYTSILVYLGKAGRYYAQNTAKCLLKCIVTSPEKYIKDMTANKKSVEQYLGVMASENLHDALNKAERQRFFDWLSEIQYEKQHRAKVKLLLPETERADPEQVLRSILEQLSSTDMDAPIRQPIVDAYRQHEREAR